MKIYLGVCVDGPERYTALAINTIYSALTKSNIVFDGIMVATDDKERVAYIAHIFREVFLNKVIHVEPNAWSQSSVPKMKGGFSTYWKFDLFNFLKEGEYLFYVDLDAIIVDTVPISGYIEAMNRLNINMSAVPSVRPVLERYSSLGLSDPYSYFNAGILLGRRCKKYKYEYIQKKANEILLTDEYGLIWHDQDIFNYIFKEKYYKLPYSMNVHTGFVSKGIFFKSMFNNILREEIFKYPKVIHFSGGVLNGYFQHYFKFKYRESLIETLLLLKMNKSSEDNALNFIDNRVFLEIKLLINYTTGIKIFFYKMLIYIKIFLRYFYFKSKSLVDRLHDR